MREPINWKLFWILLGASIFAIIALIPVIPTILSNLPEDYSPRLPLPLHLLLVFQLVLVVFVCAVCIFFGLHLSRRVGLGVPILEGWLEGKEVRTHLKSILGISIGLAVLVGLLTTGIQSLSSLFGKPLTISEITLPIWQRFLLSFYGGIVEEIMLRLFLMTLLVWIFYKIKKTEEDKPTNMGLWLAIIISALLFGIGHLLAAASLTSLTPFVVAHIVVGNAIGGMAWGWLYWRKGLESAMISHFSVHMIFNVIWSMF